MSDNKDSIFYWSNGLPFHISVGAVVLNDNNEVLVHHFPAGTAAKIETYLLMRESLEMKETLLEAVDRGLVEEFGIKAKLREFIGTIVCDFHHGDGMEIEKTTLYFLLEQPEELPAGRQKGAPESKSTLEWWNLDELAELSRQQAKVLDRTDFDESKILERVAEIIKAQA